MRPWHQSCPDNDAVSTAPCCRPRRCHRRCMRRHDRDHCQYGHNEGCRLVSADFEPSPFPWRQLSYVDGAVKVDAHKDATIGRKLALSCFRRIAPFPPRCFLCLFLDTIISVSHRQHRCPRLCPLPRSACTRPWSSPRPCPRQQGFKTTVSSLIVAAPAKLSSSGCDSRACAGDSIVCWGRSNAGQGQPFLSLCRVDCYTVPCSCSVQCVCLRHILHDLVISKEALRGCSTGGDGHRSHPHRKCW